MANKARKHIASSGINGLILKTGWAFLYKECDQKVLSAKKIETKTCDILKAVHTKGGGGSHIKDNTLVSWNNGGVSRAAAG